MSSSNMITLIGRAFRHPGRACSLAKRKMKQLFLWDYYYSRLREPKVKAWIDLNPEMHKDITKKLIQNGFDVLDFRIDVAAYRHYMERAKYHTFPNYRRGGKEGNFAEKSLEHYLATEFLALSKEDTYIDIANADSPTPEIYGKLFGCRAYRQDLSFPEGIHGNVIGGDAAKLPVENGFATKIALHCSFEHFEQDSDMLFIKEMGRILRNGGKACILPFYLFNRYAIATDPAALPKGGITFDDDAILFCARGWGNQHGRYYDVPHIITRIRDNLDGLKLTIYVIQNEKDVNPSCFVRFVALFEKE